MTAKDDRKNAEGYNDPTAYNAIKNVEQELDKDEARFHQLLNTLFSICELADFHIEERVVLKDKRGRCDETLQSKTRYFNLFRLYSYSRNVQRG